MDLFKKFSEKTAEVKNKILGADAINSITSAVGSVNLNDNSNGNNNGNGPVSNADSPGAQASGGQMSLMSTLSNAVGLGSSQDSPVASSPPEPIHPVVIPVLSKTKKGHSMHGTIDMKTLNTQLYSREAKKTPSAQQANVQVSEQGDENLGTVKCIFEYQQGNGIFVVTVDRITGLSNPTDGSALDPFCHVQLLPDKHVFTTKVVKDSLNPIFGEQIMFDVPDEDDLPNRILELTVAHRDQSATGQLIGWMRVAMNEFDMSTRTNAFEVYRFLLSPDKKEGCKSLGGNLLISISYLGSAKRLTVYVHEAKQLHFMDQPNENTDSVVRVSLLIDGKKSRKRKTAAQHGPDVVWNEAITFTDISSDIISQQRLQAIDVEVCHESLLGDKTLGHIIICGAGTAPSAIAHWNAFRQGEETPRWHRLRFSTNS